MIAVAPNGARKTKVDHPAMPITEDELAHTAAQCLDAGACMIHLHVRDENQRHTLDTARYKAVIAAVRNRVGSELIIQVTSEAVGIYSAERQMQMVTELKPEAVSLAVRELCPEGGEDKRAATFFSWLQGERIIPQYILYSKQDVLYFNDLRERGIIPGDRVSVLYVLGKYSETQQSSAVELLPFLAAMHGDVIWAVCAFGTSEAACMLSAAGLGGHCRVGFENNMQLISGDIAPHNAALVTQVAENAVLMDRTVASPADARQLLGMERG